MKSRIVLGIFALLLMSGSFTGTAVAQDSIYSASGDVAVVSKYIWRGQRLTNDWSLQPSMTLGAGGFAFNAWGTIDMTAVNPGDALPITGGGDGLQGKFTEVDYTFSYDHSFEDVSVGVGTIFYAFPDRGASLATTTEIYGTLSFDSAPLAPSITAYFDVDETNAGGGTSGVYVNFGVGHSFAFNHDVFTGLDFSASIAFANSGFGDFYYGAGPGGGVHDTSITLGLPIAIDDNWSAGGFLTYSGLIGDYRGSQYGDPRVTGSGGASMADTV